MKALSLTVWWLCLSAIPAFATGHGSHPRSAPVPLIGFGLPAALAVGGLLLGTKLLKRRRKSR